MGTGELVHDRDAAAVDPAELPYGAAVTESGRISRAQEYVPAAPNGPFTTQQLSRIDEALALATRDTGIDFSIYLGSLGAEDSRAAAEQLHDRLGTRGDDAVLIAVSPGERVVEIVTGANTTQRVPDRAVKLAVMSMVASFKEGDLTGGFVSGLRMMADQAGSRPTH
ncbi:MULTISPECIES: DUF5130 family protein [Prauserella salsuginis group]|uniref:DUF5130 family protein n=2 Tax=Prauserella salsuginis group TaxID=2893672 RepID=A0ABW6G861_9PSEU|nr:MULTISPECIES: DUF5130 family protein [Prauserella salsuginis group]MBB3664293.1 putative membrane protein YgcG [Prauserella sediminis]MCR3721738.1 TLP18.3, Psb32 and MOLO-1 founding protein of phosphatase [Prauserella flava]MCR3734429.1 TLP18.3, Psb32 and MOLO-1 founding protein of phosphatase [Prauserella salsuginis]